MNSGNAVFGKRKRIPKWLPAALCIAVAALIAIACITVLSVKQKRKAEANRVSGGSFVADGFENISEIKNVDEKFNVFTDSKSGKQGIISPDGVITEKAENSDFSILSDKWRNKRYTVKSPKSEYILLVDTLTMRISNKQYHGAEKPEKIPCWSEENDYLAWADELGVNGKIKQNELNLKSGLYPVATDLSDNAKWGYISSRLTLEIAVVYDGAMDFSQGVGAVKKDGKWGYINEIGIKLIPFEYESVNECDLLGRDIAFSFLNGLAPVKKGGKYGIINLRGEEVVSFVFDRILQGKNGKYLAFKDGKWGILTVDQSLISAAAEGQSTTVAVSQKSIPVGSYTVETSGSVLNMRMTADSESSVVGKLPKGTVVEVTDSVPGWAYVTYKNSKGWVSSDFLKKYVPPVSTTKTGEIVEKSSQNKTVSN